LGRWSSIKKDFYNGNFKLGNREGYGVYNYKNGSKYEGHWKNGSSNGHGSYTFANGDNYTGEFLNGRFNGKGIYKFKNSASETLDGIFKDGKFMSIPA